MKRWVFLLGKSPSVSDRSRTNDLPNPIPSALPLSEKSMAIRPPTDNYLAVLLMTQSHVPF